jgi:beta-lactamase regulating signal transducer with metallopeptidase domain
MATWSQSHFLQALGWATLNSFWQMAILWCLFLGANHLFKLSANKKYQAAVGAMLLGFTWFITTFVLYYKNNSSTYAFFENSIPHSNSILHICLLSASITYLLLLSFPAIRLVKNWRFVQVIKKEGQGKADLAYRLFVQNIAGHLGITKKVKLVVSNLVSSPVTIGYLKPMILLPVATLNQLSTAQVEAILLHELSHIRRYDYLINLIVSIIHTLLYFNPFVKFFMTTVESERETCCDELVLQFGYDKVGYAAALLHLEKTSGKHAVLTLAAAGKQNLLARIEKIVGMEKKKSFKLIQVVPLFAAMICVLLFNSVLIIKDAKNGAGISYANDGTLMSWQLYNNSKGNKILTPALERTILKHPQNLIASSNKINVDIFNIPAQEQQAAVDLSPAIENIIPVNFDDVDGHLTKEEKANVKSTVAATKKVVGALQWKEIEASIGEVLDDDEKALAKKEYLQEVEKVNWNNIEQNLKAAYDELDWSAINENVNKAMVQVQLDSLQTIYSQALTELQKVEKELKSKTRLMFSPVPDCSVDQITIAKQTLRRNLDSIKSIRPKKVVRL